MRDGIWVPDPGPSGVNVRASSHPGVVGERLNSRVYLALSVVGPVLLLAFSLLAILAGLTATWHAQDMLDRGRPVVGVVERAGTDSRTGPWAAVRYEVDGREYHENVNGRAEVGDRVELLYDPQHPDSAIEADAWPAGGLVMAAAGVVGTVVSLLGLRWTLRRRRLAAAPGAPAV